MSNLNHPVVIGAAAGGAGALVKQIGQKFTDGIGGFLKDSLSSAVGNIAVTAVENTLSDSGDGVKGFKLEEGDREPLKNITSQSTQALASALRVECVLDPNTASLEDIQMQQGRIASGGGSLNELNNRIVSDPTQGDVLNNTLATKVEMDQQGAGEFLTGVSNVGIAALDSLGLIPSGLSDALRSIVNGATGGGGKRDSRFVSREYHEFAYCRSSDSTGTSPITNVLRFMIHWDNRGASVPGTIYEDLIYHESAGQSLLDQDLFNTIDNRSISYGQFVDMYCLREFIALFRKIRRKVFAANVKCAFDLVDPPLDQGLLMNQVIAQLDFTPLVLEFNRTFNDGVAFGTNRRFKEVGRIDDGGQGLTGSPDFTPLPDDDSSTGGNIGAPSDGQSGGEDIPRQDANLELVIAEVANLLSFDIPDEIDEINVVIVDYFNQQPGAVVSFDSQVDEFARLWGLMIEDTEIDGPLADNSVLAAAWDRVTGQFGA